MVGFRFKLPMLARQKRGASALEYALVMAFVAVGVLAALNALSGNVRRSMNSVGRTVAAAPGEIR